MIGVGVAPRAGDQPGARDDGDREGAEDARAGPAPVGALDDGRHQAGHRDREEGGAQQVGLVGRPGRAPRASRRTPNTSASRLKGRLTRKTQRQLTWTRRPPIGGPNAAAAPPTADHRPMAAPLRAGPKAGRRRPREVGSISAPPVAWRTRAADEEAQRGGEGAQGGGGGEDGQPEEEGPLAPGPVGPAAGRHQGGGEDDGVGAEHPRQGAQALAVEVRRDAGEGDVDDEEVQRGQEHAGQHDERRSGWAGWPGRARRSEPSVSSVMRLDPNGESCMKQRIRGKCAVCWVDAESRLPEPVLPGGGDARGGRRAVDPPDHPRRLPGHPALRRSPT